MSQLLDRAERCALLGRRGQGRAVLDVLEVGALGPAEQVRAAVCAARCAVEEQERTRALAAVEAAEALGQPELCARALVALAVVETRARRWRRAAELLERAIAQGDPSTVADALRRLAACRERLEGPGAGAALYEKAWARLQSEPFGAGWCALDRAGTSLDAAELDAARRWLSVATSLLEPHGVSLPLVAARRLAALLAGQEGAHEDAVEAGREAVALATELGEPVPLLRCLTTTSSALRHVGRADEAVELLRRAVALGEDLPSVRVIFARLNLGLLELERGRPGRARSLLLRVAVDLPGRVGPIQAATVHAALTACAADAGDWSAWDLQLTRALSLVERAPDATVPDLRTLAAIARGAAHSAAERGELSRASRAHALVLRLLAEVDEPAARGVRAELLDLARRGARVSLGPFELDVRLGQGGMGEVWGAVHVATATPAAIKVLGGEGTLDHEVQAVARLRHPAIVGVLDVGVVDDAAAVMSEGALTPGAAWFAMERLDGGTLSALCGRLPWPEVRQVLLSLLDALAHAHAHGVLHLDLKPNNVLLAQVGANLDVRLADFGLAYAYRSGGDGRAAGTPTSMAPEQWRGQWRAWGPPTDLYGLGCLAWELVTGAPPFDGPAARAVRDLHLLREPPPLPPVHAPPGLEGWLRRLLCKDPGARFQVAADAAWSLASLEEPVGVPPEPGVQGPLRPTVDGATLVLEDLIAAVTTARRASEPAAPLGRPPVPARARSDAAHAGSPVHPSARLFGAKWGGLVGREAEVAALWGALRDVHATGEPVRVEVRGPVGAGSTALALWVGTHAAEVGAAELAVARCGEPGGGLAGMLREATGTRGCTGLALRDQLLARLRRFDPALDADGVAVLAEALRTGRDARPEVLRTAASRWLATATRARPVVVVLDDVDRDPDALAWLAGHLPALPVLIAFTAGSGPSHPALVGLRARGDVRTVELGPLPDPSVHVLLARSLSLAPELRDLVIRRADGNPRYALQLARSWLDDGLLVPTPSGLARAPGVRLVAPAGGVELLRARLAQILDGLPRTSSTLVELAAHLGFRIEPELLERAAAAAEVPLDGRVEERLLASGLWVRDADGVRFASLAERDAVVALSASQGRACHRACAEALADRSDADGMARRARHLAHAGVGAEVLDALQRAAQALDVRGRRQEAAELLVLWHERAEVLAVGPEDPRWRVAISQLVRALSGQRRHQLAVDWAEQLLEAAQRADDADAEAVAHNALGSAAMWRQDVGAAERHYAEARRVGLRAGLDERVGIATWSLADVARHHGRTEEAAALLSEATALLEASRPEARARTAYVQAAAADERGDVEAALTLLEEALSLAVAQRRYMLAPSIANRLGDVLRRNGRPERALACYSRSLSFVAPGLGATYYELNRALAALALGDSEPLLHFRELYGAALLAEAGHASEALRLAEIPLYAPSEDDGAYAARLALARGQVDATDDPVELAWLCELAGDRAWGAGRVERARDLWAIAERQLRSLPRPDQSRRVADKLGASS